MSNVCFARSATADEGGFSCDMRRSKRADKYAAGASRPPIGILLDCCFLHGKPRICARPFFRRASSSTHPKKRLLIHRYIDARGTSWASFVWHTVLYKRHQTIHSSTHSHTHIFHAAPPFHTYNILGTTREKSKSFTSLRWLIPRHCYGLPSKYQYIILCRH